MTCADSWFIVKVSLRSVWGRAHSTKGTVYRFATAVHLLQSLLSKRTMDYRVLLLVLLATMLASGQERSGWGGGYGKRAVSRELEATERRQYDDVRGVFAHALNGMNRSS